ncbi:MAG TPA: 4'-phosphopantetheinyl transferase superfamily protein [Thermoanaerobaculia bacterium]|nr:4'-phosphopantetheinyl transferase superfamily protein [Thermoanaerobaculia bacterium]
MSHLRYLLAEATDVPDGDTWLALSEAAFQQTLHIPHRRADWRLGRWAAKKALAAWLGQSVAPERIAIHPAPDGAPEMLLDGGAAPVALSYSHRAGRALCMLAPLGTTLGCDLELIEPRTDAFVADYFTAAERDLVTQASSTERPLLANLLWSAKESALKALRTGLRMDTRSVEVDLEDWRVEGSQPWKPLRVRLVETGKIFQGWWRREEDSLLTLCASPAQREPALPARNFPFIVPPRCPPRDPRPVFLMAFNETPPSPPAPG